MPNLDLIWPSYAQNSAWEAFEMAWACMGSLVATPCPRGPALMLPTPQGPAPSTKRPTPRASTLNILVAMK